MTSEYFKGAVTAYEDCAEFVDDLAQRLPEELKFLSPTFLELGERMRNKARSVELLGTQIHGEQ